MIEKLRELYINFVLKDIKNTENIPSVQKWEQYLNKLGHDANYLTEAYRKYKCRLLYIKWIKQIILNISALFFLMIKPPRIINQDDTKTKRINCDALLVEKGFITAKSIFPQELKEKYNRIETVDETQLRDRRLLRDIYNVYKEAKRKYLLHPYFLLLLQKDLIMLSNCIEKYTFNALISYDCERDISSPVITTYLEGIHKKYISFMHGEYLLQIIQAYSMFSEYYVWDNIYIEMFQKILKCNTKEYKVYTPDKLKKKWDFRNIKTNHLFTYYLSGESIVTLKKLADIAEKIEASGYQFKIRPHPRYSHKKMIEELFTESQIENPDVIDIKTSLGSAEYIVGLSTTVLSEAYNEGKRIVIDDYTNIPQYKNLYDRYSIALRKEHLLFSDLLKKIIPNGEI